MAEGSIEQVRSRLQFVIVLAMFFPTLIEALFKVSADELGSSRFVLSWGMIIVVLVSCYLLIEVTRREISAWSARLIGALLLVEVAAFLPVLFVFAQTEHRYFPAVLNHVLLRGSLYVLMYNPLAIFVLLSIGTHLFPRWRVKS